MASSDRDGPRCAWEGCEAQNPTNAVVGYLQPGMIAQDTRYVGPAVKLTAAVCDEHAALISRGVPASLTIAVRPEPAVAVSDGE